MFNDGKKTVSRGLPREAATDEAPVHPLVDATRIAMRSVVAAMVPVKEKWMLCPWTNTCGFAFNGCIDVKVGRETTTTVVCLT